MKGDFSRMTFDPLKGYMQVRMQQGRVQLDSDWNEQVEIQTYFLRRLARDLIGPHGGPAGSFVLTPKKNAGGDVNGFTLSTGHYYVDGTPVENPGEYTYPLEIPDLPFLIYLDVWEEHITFLDDDSIREVALNGADTATRVRVCWEVRVDHPDAAIDDWDDYFQDLQAAWKAHGALKAWTRKPTAADLEAPCILDSAAGYRRGDNRLYRVEIHHPSHNEKGELQPAGFKWSRDNGSVAFEWLDTNGDDLIVAGVRDLEHGFAANQWVELTDARRERLGLAGTLVRLQTVEGDCLTVDPSTATGSLNRSDFSPSPRLRRWDHVALSPAEAGAGEVAGVMPLRPDEPVELEAGIMIQFTKPEVGGPFYRGGDYWLIPARAAIGDILWPQEAAPGGSTTPAFRPPHGINHVFAPLGVILDNDNLVDLRRKIKPLTE